MLVKALGPGMPTAWPVFLRNALALPALALALRLAGHDLRSERPIPLVLRGLLGVAAMGCLFWALPRMPLANVMLLSHASPLYAALWGSLFLNERLDRASLGFIAVAFAGVVLTLRPTLGFVPAATAAAAASGFLASLALATIRSLSGREPPLRVIFYLAWVGSLALVPFVAAADYLPSAREWALMAAVSLCATVGQLLLTMGVYRAPVAKASLGALFIIVVNVAGGVLFWGEVPDAWTWGGCLLIAGGILGLALDLRRRLMVTVAD